MGTPLVSHAVGGGRGRVVGSNMRRPGNFNPAKVSNPVGQASDPIGRLKPIENLMNEMTLSSLEDETLGSVQMQSLIDKVKSTCVSALDVELLVNAVHTYCLKDKESAQIGAIFSGHIGDFEVEGKKFRTLLLQKIQSDFEDRENVFPQTEKFIQNVILFCELFQNLRLANGDCFVVLTSPLITYLEMLLRNASEPEIETFIEQTSRCYRELQLHREEAFGKLIFKIRTNIVTGTSELTRWRFLKLLEEIQTGKNLKPVDEEFFKVMMQKVKFFN